MAFIWKWIVLRKGRQKWGNTCSKGPQGSTPTRDNHLEDWGLHTLGACTNHIKNVMWIRRLHWESVGLAIRKTFGRSTGRSGAKFQRLLRLLATLILQFDATWRYSYIWTIIVYIVLWRVSFVCNFHFGKLNCNIGLHIKSSFPPITLPLLA